MEAALNPHPDLGKYFAAPAVVSEALAILPALEKAAAPTTKAQISRWLLPLGGAVGNPPVDDRDYRRRLLLIVQVSGDLPAIVFSAKSQTEALRQFDWWPSPAKVDTLPRPLARDLPRNLREARWVLASVPTAQADPEERPRHGRGPGCGARQVPAGDSYRAPWLFPAEGGDPAGAEAKPCPRDAGGALGAARSSDWWRGDGHPEIAARVASLRAEVAA